jgi:hypothetical protein
VLKSLEVIVFTDEFYDLFAPFVSFVYQLKKKLFFGIFHPSLWVFSNKNLFLKIDNPLKSLKMKKRVKNKNNLTVFFNKKNQIGFEISKIIFFFFFLKF